MANKELRLRLIKNGEISNIIRLVPGKGAFSRNPNQEECDFIHVDMNFIMAECCDSFDQGYQMPDGTWVFTGDIFQIHDEGGIIKEWKANLVYNSTNGSFSLEHVDNYDYSYYIHELSVIKFTMNKIGSIHDEPELMPQDEINNLMSGLDKPDKEEK